MNACHVFANCCFMIQAEDLCVHVSGISRFGYHCSYPGQQDKCLKCFQHNALHLFLVTVTNHIMVALIPCCDYCGNVLLCNSAIFSLYTTIMFCMQQNILLTVFNECPLFSQPVVSAANTGPGRVTQETGSDTFLHVTSEL